MPLIKNGTLAEDPWRLLTEAEQLPETGHVAVSLTRWQIEKSDLLARSTPLGVVLRSSEPVEEIATDVASFALIALEFPVFQDGRPYSSARLLRERYGYEGELRAIGEVSRDQFLFMYRCGFDAYEIGSDDVLEDWLRAVSEISVWYQPTGSGRSALTKLRHQP